MTIDDVIRDAVRKAVTDELVDLRRAVDALKDSIAANRPADPATAEYLSPEQAAELAGVKAQTVRRWVTRGELPGHRAGRLLRVRRDQLRAFLAAAPRTDGPAPPDDELLSRRLFGR